MLSSQITGKLIFLTWSYNNLYYLLNFYCLVFATLSFDMKTSCQICSDLTLFWRAIFPPAVFLNIAQTPLGLGS